MGILTPLQKDVIRGLRQEPLFRDFFLTGGTALSACYLHHRLSEDLDFFTPVLQNVARMPSVMARLAKKMHLDLLAGRRFTTLFECDLQTPRGDCVELDFALDMPNRLAPLRFHKTLRIAIDNPLDIACNKLSALYERAEAKDFVDVFWITRRLFPLDHLLTKTRQKYPGLDSYGLAMAFFRVKAIDFWPRMVRPFSSEGLRRFFLRQAERFAKDFTRPHRP